MLVLTAGKPNDVDHYEGRFALEDTRRAVMEARRSGLSVSVSLSTAMPKLHVPAMFGWNGYAVVGNIARLPSALSCHLPRSCWLGRKVAGSRADRPQR